MEINYDVINFISKFQPFILRKPLLAFFVDIIKIVTMFIKRIFKGSKKVNKIEIMYQSAIYICFFI